MERSTIGERAYDMALLIRKFSNLKPRIHNCFLRIMAAIPTSICLLLASISPLVLSWIKRTRFSSMGGGTQTPNQNPVPLYGAIVEFSQMAHLSWPLSQRSINIAAWDL